MVTRSGIVAADSVMIMSGSDPACVIVMKGASGRDLEPDVTQLYVSMKGTMYAFGWLAGATLMWW